MIDMLTEVQFYPNLWNTGFSEFRHLLNFITDPFNLPEKSVMIYRDFLNFNFSNYPIFQRDYLAYPFNSPKILKS